MKLTMFNKVFGKLKAETSNAMATIGKLSEFYTYESLKQHILSSDQPKTWQTLLCGGLAGSTAALFSTIFDVVKTRYQTHVPGSAKQYSGVFNAIKQIRKIEGVMGLYRGLTPRLIMYMSQGALFFTSYEFFKGLFFSERPLQNTRLIRPEPGQLKQYDGSDPSKPIYVAVKGRVFDVTTDNNFYGPGGLYAMFVDKDTSRALAVMSKNEEDVSPSLHGLADKEFGVLADWEKKFEAKC